MKKIVLFCAVALLFAVPLTAHAADASVCPRWGDMDGDGKTTAADARLILRQSVSLEDYPQEALDRCDTDDDERITAADARFALRLSVGLEQFPGHKTAERPEQPPTCTQSGLTKGTYCKACGMTFTVQETIPATGHTEEIDAAVAPTCTEEGLTEGKHCSVCNAVLIKQESVPATGHKEVIDQAVAPT